MNYLIDQSFLLLYCLGALLFVPASISFIISFFLTVSVSAALYAHMETPGAFALVCCFVLAVFSVPELVWFAPLAACFFFYALQSEGIWKRLYFAALVCFAVFFLIRLCLLHDFRLTFYVICGSAFALLLCRRTYSYETSAGKYRRISD